MRVAERGVGIYCGGAKLPNFGVKHYRKREQTRGRRGQVLSLWRVMGWPFNRTINAKTALPITSIGSWNYSSQFVLVAAEQIIGRLHLTGFPAQLLDSCLCSLHSGSQFTEFIRRKVSVCQGAAAEAMST